MEEFMYEREVAPCGIAVEKIYGADEKSAKVWKLFAMQIFSEAEGDYRSIGHYECGAPYIDGKNQSISISHTPHFLVVASIPETPNICIEGINVRTAIGVDIEKADRAQVIKIKDKFLTPEELDMLPTADDPENVTAETIKEYILAWTCKEAMYKAVMGIAPDWKKNYQIGWLPKIAPCLAEATLAKYGRGSIICNGNFMEIWLSSWEESGHIMTLAFTPVIPTFTQPQPYDISQFPFH